LNDDEFIFAIDTDTYAGSFERQMCAYISGRIGECEVGKKEADIYFKEEFGSPKEELNFKDQDAFDFIIDQPDEHGCFRPVSIYPTPGLFNHGMGGIFADGQEEEALEDYRKECLKYSKKTGNKENLPLFSPSTLKKHEAFCSVAIYMARRPTEEEINALKHRVYKFVEYYKGHKFKITGFRLIKETKMVFEEEV